MNKKTVAVLVVGMVLSSAYVGSGPVGASAPSAFPRATSATVQAIDSERAGLASESVPQRGLSGPAIAAALAAATITPAQAVAQASSEASANGITDYVSVTDPHTGAVLAQSGNAGTQVASESIVKLMIASYYMVLTGGFLNQSASVLSQLSYMIRYSDDATASAYFTSAVVPTIAARYGMTSTINATDRVGHWGAVRITAHDMTTFLYRALHDPEVGPWLGPVMAQVAPTGSDGFNQAFGMNSLSGTHGSKQGWGDDQFWTAASNVINSVGYTDRYLVAILQNSYSYPDPARATSTYAARTIAASRPAVGAPPPPSPPKNGDFIKTAGQPGVYRIAGGAPIYVGSWAPFGGVQTVKTISTAQWNALRAVPADGTFIRSTSGGEVYRIAGGAPLYVSTWAVFGGVQATVTVDAAAIERAGHTGVWAHLRNVPVDGTFITTTGHQIFKIVSATPIFVSNWAHVGGVHATTVVDTADVTHAGQSVQFSHLRPTLPDGVFINDGTGIYVMAGGAPISIATWSVFGGPKSAQLVDSEALRLAGTGGQWSHIRAVPADATYIRAGATGTIYRLAGGAPLYVYHLLNLTPNPKVIIVDPAALNNSGLAGRWSHLRKYPADGTYLKGIPTSKFYKVLGGHANQVTSGAVKFIPIEQATIDRAGQGGVFNHLK